MGIQGLLPLLKSIQQPICLSELTGSTVGVDVYCWLHKGAYGCALELAEGKDSDLYIKYVMRRVNLMLYYKVTPILVFDGGYLPSKSEKEAERREKRKEYKSQGLAHLKNGNQTKAVECFQKSIDITPEMALNLMKVCREKGVDYIVAPYEADAQLAYLTKAGITQYTISEDSDLLVYECEKVIFKMDANGCGLLVDLKQLSKLKNVRMESFTRQKFREMCILSGCDYLNSVKGMGLITAHKMLKKHSTIEKLISTLRLNTKMIVPKDYEERFKKAEQTFLYQIVFDPKTNIFVPLNPLPKELIASNLMFAGHNLKWKQEEAFDVAIGNINPLTGQRIASFKQSKVLLFGEKHLSSTIDGKNLKKKSIPTIKTFICPQEKKSCSKFAIDVAHSKMTTYDVEKNLNRAYGEKKSSEKAMSTFVTPLVAKTKFVKSEINEVNEENLKLERLYSTSEDELTVDVNHNVSEAGSIFRMNGQPQLKIRRNNPFRSPMYKIKKEEQVVSRYFGLAGMEAVQNKQPSDDSMKSDTVMVIKELTNTNVENESCVTSQSSEGTEFQESGYFSDNGTQEKTPLEEPEIENSSSLKELLPKDFPSTSHTMSSYSSTTTSPKHPETPKNKNGGKRKRLSETSISSQMSLDKFAFNKETLLSLNKKDKCSSPRKLCLPTNFTAPIEEGAEEDLKENQENICQLFKQEDMKRVRVDTEEFYHKSSHVTKMKKSCPKTEIVGKPSRLLGLRTQTTNGLVRCRTVGLSRPTKDTSKKNSNVAPSFKYLSYQGRNKPFKI